MDKEKQTKNKLTNKQTSAKRDKYLVDGVKFTVQLCYIFLKLFFLPTFHYSRPFFFGRRVFVQNDFFGGAYPVEISGQFPFQLLLFSASLILNGPFPYAMNTTTYPLSTPSTKFNMKNEPNTINGIKYKVVNLFPRAS
uniref:Uncharacterized protein n=1 Tax=Romanomermis culicivorax TaxID=13658 RepID=A0A915KCN3_ROMCU